MSEELLKRETDIPGSETGSAGLPLGSISVSTYMLDKAATEALITTSVTSAWRAGGSLAASGLVSGLLVAGNDGKVYNLNEAFTTTADFVEGAGKWYAAGTNVAVINNGTIAEPSYKFDVLGGTDQSVVRTITVGNGSALTPSNGAITIPVASSSADGVVKLSDSTSDSTSDAAAGVAATPKAVKDALDAAKANDSTYAISGAAGTGDDAGKYVVTLTGSGHDTGTSTAKIPAATNSAAGIVTLSDATDGTEAAASGKTAATPKAVSDALTAAKGYADTKVSGLDAEVTSSGGTNVQVKVTEVDGVITAVNITTDNTLAASDIAGKADKVSGAIEGNFASLDVNGNLTDSGKRAASFQPAGSYKTTQASAVTTPEADGTAVSFIDEIQQNTNGDITTITKKTIPTVAASTSGAGGTNGLMTAAQAEKLNGVATGAQVNVIETVKVDGAALTVTDKAVNIDLTGKADKVASATNGNFAGLDSNGNLTDSGSKASDFATSAQGSKADSAVQSVTVGDVTLTKDANKGVTVEVDGTYSSTNKVATQSTVSGAISALAGSANSTGGTNVALTVATSGGQVSTVTITTDDTMHKQAVYNALHTANVDTAEQPTTLNGTITLLMSLINALKGINAPSA